jgi:hypothetical protein
MFRAPRNGTLPRDDARSLAGVALPVGRRISPDSNVPDSVAEESAVLWISVEPIARVEELVDVLARNFSETGLWPLALESHTHDDARPWLDGDLDPSKSTSPSTHDPRATLAEWWKQAIADAAGHAALLDVLAPFDRKFPGLAAEVTIEPEERIDIESIELPGRLGLVAVTRPADALATIGWRGPLNHYWDMGKLSSVLRSWEDRFGAHLIGVGFDTITLLVDRPPATLDVAEAIAAEHLAACPDSIFQGSGSIRSYAADLVDRSVWSLWWD